MTLTCTTKEHTVQWSWDPPICSPENDA